MSIQSVTDIRADNPVVTLSASDLFLIDQTLKTVAATLAELKVFVRPALASTSEDGLMAAGEKVKLAGIAGQATKNQTDNYLLSRANHSGTQSIATITGLQDALNAKMDSGEALDIADVSGLESSLTAINNALSDLSDDLDALILSAGQTQSDLDIAETAIAGKLPINNPTPTGAFRVPLYTLSSLPSTTGIQNYLIFVTDATDGRALCYADGSDWKIVGTDTIVS